MYPGYFRRFHGGGFRHRHAGRWRWLDRPWQGGGQPAPQFAPWPAPWRGDWTPPAFGQWSPPRVGPWLPPTVPPQFPPVGPRPGVTPGGPGHRPGEGPGQPVGGPAGRHDGAPPGQPPGEQGRGRHGKGSGQPGQPGKPPGQPPPTTPEQPGKGKDSKGKDSGGPAGTSGKPAGAGPQPTGQPGKAPGPKPAPTAGPTSEPSNGAPGKGGGAPPAQPTGGAGQLAAGTPEPSGQPAPAPHGKRSHSAVQQEASGAAFADPNILVFRIPEDPYEDQLIAPLHKTIDVAEAVKYTLEIFAPEIAELALGPELLGPVAALLPIAIGYEEARHHIVQKNLRYSFSEGVVAGASKASWAFTKAVFWQDQPGFNPVDKRDGVLAQKAHNLGLGAGFVQGRQLSEKQKQFLLASIRKQFTPDDARYYGGDHKSWSKRNWFDYYTFMAAKFAALYLKD